MRTRLDVLSLALAFGITMAALMFLFGIAAWLTGLWVAAVEMVATVYIGFAPTPLGSVIGGAWTLLEGLIFGAIVAWLYNVILTITGRGNDSADVLAH